jgi:trimeric autotransporter adhesin
MSSTKPNLRLIGALAALAGLALAISCQGFFPPKTLTSITVDPPTPTVNIGSTVQMYASGTFSDGSTGTLSSGTSCTGNTVCWSESSGGTVTTISTGGLITGVTDGTSTVTATASGISGDTTVTVALANVTALTLSENTYTISPYNGTTTATCSAQTSSGPVDVTATATWSVANTAYATVTSGTDPVVIQGVASGSTTITASYMDSTGNTYTATATLNVE